MKPFQGLDGDAGEERIRVWPKYEGECCRREAVGFGERRHAISIVAFVAVGLADVLGQGCQLTSGLELRNHVEDGPVDFVECAQRPKKLVDESAAPESE